jgi:hypothetical protein
VEERIRRKRRRRGIVGSAGKQVVIRPVRACRSDVVSAAVREEKGDGG